jgi:hypothetical protein
MGVFKKKDGRFCVQYHAKYEQRIWLGSYDTFEQARMIYEEIAKCDQSNNKLWLLAIVAATRCADKRKRKRKLLSVYDK